MPPRFVLDENLRGRLWQAIQTHNSQSGQPIDAVRVGDLPDLPLGIQDPLLLLWAEQAGRILVTADQLTMIAHLGDHQAAGHHSPGVFIIRSGSSLRDLLGFFALVAEEDEMNQWRNLVQFIP